MTGGSFIVLSFVYVEMWDDKEGANFAILLVLFLAFMGVLVSSANLFIFYLGWEGIGLTSLFLINFWSERARAVKATLKVYIINKVGDFLILTGLCLLFLNLGTTDFIFLNNFAVLLNNFEISIGTAAINILELTALLFVIGGGVKSAQFGFHIWLLEAMEAPLGASALMHSSTLVVAGVILVYKLSGLIGFTTLALKWLIIWGSWTALFAAAIACFQYELKIILAYSTISSMGFLYCLLGLQAHTVMLNYLIIHAFIKIFLFLVVGAIMLHCSGCQDIRWMGGLLHYVPHLYIYFIIGSCGLAGLPYCSGYYCKSGTWFILSSVNNYAPVTNIIILFTTLLTYIYLTRVTFIVFFGPKNGHRHIYRLRHQSPLSVVSFFVLASVVAYTGTIWTTFCETNLEAITSYFYASYYLPLLTHVTSFFTPWWQLTAIYVTSLCVFFLIFLRNLNALYNFFLYYFLYYLAFFCAILFYVCL